MVDAVPGEQFCEEESTTFLSLFEKRSLKWQTQFRASSCSAKRSGRPFCIFLRSEARNGRRRFERRAVQRRGVDNLFVCCFEKRSLTCRMPFRLISCSAKRSRRAMICVGRWAIRRARSRRPDHASGGGKIPSSSMAVWGVARSILELVTR